MYVYTSGSSQLHPDPQPWFNPGFSIHIISYVDPDPMKKGDPNRRGLKNVKNIDLF